MKKYIKPDVQIIRFDIKSAVMTGDNTGDAIMASSSMAVELSPLSTNEYIPAADSIDGKVWSNVDGENWNWE